MGKNRKNRKDAFLDRTKKILGLTDTIVLRRVLIIMLAIFFGIILGVASFAAYRMDALNEKAKNFILYQEINTLVNVTYGSVGLNGDTDSLNFGKISANGGGTRFIYINSTQKAIVQIYFSGDMKNFLSVEKNNYIIQAGYRQEVPINIYIPSNAKAGEYCGKVHILLLKAADAGP